MRSERESDIPRRVSADRRGGDGRSSGYLVGQVMGVQQFLFEPREHSELEATGQWWSGSDWCPSAASRAPAACDSVDEVALLLGPQDATVKASEASGVRLRNDILSAIDEALGDAPVTTPTVAPGAGGGVTHRCRGLGGPGQRRDHVSSVRRRRCRAADPSSHRHVRGPPRPVRAQPGRAPHNPSSRSRPSAPEELEVWKRPNHRSVRT